VLTTLQVSRRRGRTRPSRNDIPLKGITTNCPRAAGGLPDNPGPPKVLVVEDEMLLRMRAVDIVEDAGFTPIEAVNADEAIAILESRSDLDLLSRAAHIERV
jgi:PleD family two-component response regulator